jgi:tetraacyldisaccharide 4'-kinase
MYFDIGLLKITKVSVPVISVGNITSGGTGKTPVIKNIAQILLKSGKKVAIVSRGYGRESKGFRLVSDAHKILSSVEEAGDEPMYLAQQLRDAIIIVDEQRVRGSQKAIEEYGAQVILLDDGFQHRYLHRDADIVLIDSEQSIFETKMLPTGFRREFLSSLQRTDAIVLTKTGNNNKGITDFAGRKTFVSSYESIGLKSVFSDTRISSESLRKKKIVAFCGIANPESFRKTLNGFYLDLLKLFPFTDHHRYTHNDLRMIIEESQKCFADMILTTEKDAVKIKKFELDYSQVPIYAVEMEARVYPESEWGKWILEQTEK